MNLTARSVVVAGVVVAVSASLATTTTAVSAVEGNPYSVNVYDFPSTGLTSSTTVMPGVVKGQPFTATWTGTLEDVSVPVVGVQPSTTLTVEIQDDDGFPDTTGASLASGSQAVAADGTVTFDLSASAVTLTEGEQYVLLVGASSGQASVVTDDNSGSTFASVWSYFTGNWSESDGYSLVAMVSVGGFDGDAPTVSGELSPASADGNDGWYRVNPTITYTCDDATTWVVDCPDSGLVQDGVFDLAKTVTDAAGNTGSTGALPVKVDAIAPTLVLSTDREPNSFGWFKLKVVISAECSDAGSGVASCPGDITYLSTGMVSRSAFDVAGNERVEGFRVKVDYEPPTVRVGGVRDGAVYREKPKPTCEASDGTGKSDSGVRSCEVTVERLRPGKFAATAVAKDRAGWVAKAREVYRVR